MDVATINKRLSQASWPVAVEQIEPLRLLLDSKTHGGRAVGYAETAISHIVYIEDVTFILRRPMVLDRQRLLTPEDRCAWCEAQADLNRDAPRGLSVHVVPIVRRNGELHLGGPGEIQDWVLARTRPRFDNEGSDLSREAPETAQTSRRSRRNAVGAKHNVLVQLA